MTTINDEKMNKSICGICKNYVFEPGDSFGSWCVYYKDIYNAIREGKIIVQGNSQTIDRSVRYNLYGLVYCEGYKPK